MRVTPWSRAGAVAAAAVLTVVVAATATATARADVIVPDTREVVAVSPGSVVIGQFAELRDATFDDPMVIRVEDFSGRNRPGPCLMHISVRQRVFISGCFQDFNHLWQFQPTDVTGLYRILGANGGCLDADNRFGGGNGTIVQKWDCLGPGQLNQFWWVVADEPGAVKIISNMNGQCLDIDNSTFFLTASNAQLWDCFSSRVSNEQWFHLRLTPFPPIPL